MAVRERILFDFDWKFKLADLQLARLQTGWLNTGIFREGGMSIQQDDSTWQTVSLPHDFVVEREFLPEDSLPEVDLKLSTTFNGSKPGGVAWYRKHFSIPVSDLGRRIYLYFDGIFRDSQVYLNEFYVGSHLSGYTSFYFDVTDFINYGGENLVAVRVDATQHEGWWYEGGGIYRHVWLEKTAPVHVVLWGTFVTSSVDLSRLFPGARVHIRTTVVNQTNEVVHCQLQSSVLDPKESQVAETASQVSIPPLGQVETLQEVVVKEAHLWSLNEPNLYKVMTVISQDGQEVDEQQTTFGIRDIRFDPAEGFFLNGQSLKIKGVCCHQDHAGVGIALPDQLQEFRIQKLKEMGCNAYRCSHHPPTPELLDACDRLGMLVMDENRHLSTSSEEMEQLESMVRRDRNHPSIIMWSLGNEEVYIHWKPPSALIARTMINRIKILDSTRPVTLAMCYWNPAINGTEPLDHSPFPSAEVDVMGFNYAPEHWEAYHAWRPDQPIVVSEATTCLRTRGCYQSDPDKCHMTWDDPKAQPYHEEQWAKVARYPYLSGIFLWTGFDYRGEPSPHDYPAISSHFGLMDTCGFPKDNYYYYQAWWSTKPVMHIFPHWNWYDRIGQPVKVYCFSNCDEVELFLNGKSLGSKKMEPSRHLEWDNVTYEPGVLEARGSISGAEVTTARIETTGAPYAIRLTPDRECFQADRRDVVVVAVEVIDSQGRVVPTADDDISFTLEGDGNILGVGNGNPSSHEPDKGKNRRAFNGLCQVIIQSGSQPGQIVLTARSAHLHSARTVVQTQNSIRQKR